MVSGKGKVMALNSNSSRTGTSCTANINALFGGSRLHNILIAGFVFLPCSGVFVSLDIFQHKFRHVLGWLPLPCLGSDRVAVSSA